MLLKKTMITGSTGRDLHVNVNPTFVRANEVHRLCGSPAKLEACIGKLQHPALEKTLHWMLSAGV